jgi:hypothetical protein
MESRPVIADEESLETLEEEDQEEEALDEEDLDDELVDELDDDLDEDEDLDEDDDEEAEAESEEEEEDEADEVVAEDSDSTSLEELLARRSAARKGTDDPDEVDDLIALSSEAARRDSRAKSKVTPLRNREEFVCKSCFLLKPKVQLADSKRMLCRDCV